MVHLSHVSPVTLLISAGPGVSEYVSVCLHLPFSLLSLSEAEHFQKCSTAYCIVAYFSFMSATNHSSYCNFLDVIVKIFFNCPRYVLVSREPVDQSGLILVTLILYSRAQPVMRLSN